MANGCLSERRIGVSLWEWVGCGVYVMCDRSKGNKLSSEEVEMFLERESPGGRGDERKYDRSHRGALR